ncbi:MAG: ribonuclease R, partial [Bacteroidota bacterium]
QGGTRKEGEVLRVLERARAVIVGTVQKDRKNLTLIPDDRRFSSPIIIRPGGRHRAQHGEKAVVQIASWGGEDGGPEGTVVEILGKAGEVTAELRSVIHEFQLPTSFPDPVLDEVERLSLEIPEREISRRLDLRNLLTLTIDPEDAKDFDDAVSLESLDNGNVRLGVHIADVSAFVHEETELDREALKRGTSVYLPNTVIPMLPEHLSNVVCSLRPDEDRLTFSVLMEVSPGGNVENHEIRESVIRSKRRFTYEEVDDILEESATRPKGLSPILVTTLKRMQELSKVLTRERMRKGSIDFETAEAKFRFDAEGNPVEIIRKARRDSHRLVEEFMLLANQVVARHIGLARKEEHLKPFLYRVHDSPDPDRIRELARFVEQFGFKLHIDAGVPSKAFQKLLDQVRGTEVENVINEIALRSMAKAIYSERNIGHYGLAFDYYSHFTSPIRRYPDLIIHRLLKEYAAGITHERRQLFIQRLPGVAKHSSARERVAMEAERAAVKVMQVEYMKRHIGEEFSAVVSGVTRYGMFVEVVDLLVEGMIHVRDLEDDYYTYDEKHYALIGRRTGMRFRLGDMLTVKLIRANPENRELDFILVPPDSGDRRERRRRRK